jgi:hypothetical protein
MTIRHELMERAQTDPAWDLVVAAYDAGRAMFREPFSNRSRLDLLAPGEDPSDQDQEPDDEKHDPEGDTDGAGAGR